MKSTRTIISLLVSSLLVNCTSTYPTSSYYSEPQPSHVQQANNPDNGAGAGIAMLLGMAALGVMLGDGSSSSDDSTNSSEAAAQNAQYQREENSRAHYNGRELPYPGAGY